MICSGSDKRRPCVLFLSCIGAGPKYFLQLSEDFRRQYRIIPYLFNNKVLLPQMFSALQDELREGNPLLIYHAPDLLPFLGKYREEYDGFVEKIPPDVTRISVPQPGFAPLWPFHCGDPRNNDAGRPRNRYDKLPRYPYGDSYVLRLMKQDLVADDIVSRYLALDIPAEIDLGKMLERATTITERQDKVSDVKVADFIFGTFRAKPLFQTINHMNNRLAHYISNKILNLLDCRPVPEAVLDQVTEIVERPNPIHPNIARYFGIEYASAETRYPMDEIRNVTFAEFIDDYVHYTDGLINYADGLMNNPTVAFGHPVRQSTEEVEAMADD